MWLLIHTGIKVKPYYQTILVKGATVVLDLATQSTNIYQLLWGYFHSFISIHFVYPFASLNMIYTYCCWALNFQGSHDNKIIQYITYFSCGLLAAKNDNIVLLFSEKKSRSKHAINNINERNIYRSCDKTVRHNNNKIQKNMHASSTITTVYCW